MAELGNEIVNRIYESNVVELIAPRATPNSTSSERENWIRAKVFKTCILLVGLNWTLLFYCSTMSDVNLIAFENRVFKF